MAVLLGSLELALDLDGLSRLGLSDVKLLHSGVSSDEVGESADVDEHGALGPGGGAVVADEPDL